MIKSKKRLLTEKVKTKAEEFERPVEREELVFNNSFNGVYNNETKVIISLIKEFIEKTKFPPLQNQNRIQFDEFDFEGHFGHRIERFINIIRNETDIISDYSSILRKTRLLEFYIIENLPQNIVLNNLIIEAYDIDKKNAIKIVVSYNLITKMDSFLFEIYLKKISRGCVFLDYNIL